MSHVLVFFHSATCGHSRRMDSVVDHFMRTHRGRLKVAKVELAERADLAERFGVTSGPTLLLLENLREVGRLEGRRTLPDIKEVFEPLLGLEPATAPVELVGAC